MATYKVAYQGGDVGVEVTFVCLTCEHLSDVCSPGTCSFCQGSGGGEGRRCKACRGSGLCSECLGKPQRRWEELTSKAQASILRDNSAEVAVQLAYESLWKIYRDY